MDTIIPFYVPEYYKDFVDALKLRLICKEWKEIIDKKYIYFQKNHINKNIFSKRTMIWFGECWCCGNKIKKKTIEFNYNYDNYPKRVIILCDYWICKMSAIHYYIYEFYKEKKILINPLNIDIEKEYNIPRSNPNIKTKARISHNNSFFIYYINNNFSIIMEWFENKKFYEKCIPLKLLVKHNLLGKNEFNEMKPFWIYNKVNFSDIIF